MSLKSPFFNIVVLFTIWRVSLFIIAFISPQIIPEFGARFPYFEERLIASNLPHFIWSFGNFDGVHYLGIAKDAYAYQFTQVFFPFYPLLIKLLSTLTGNLIISALLISNTAFLIGLMIFFKLLSRVFDEKVALWSIIFALVFPTSFYFGAIYTEGIFFLMIITSFYLLEKNRILAASLIGSLASATRLVGIFMGPSLFTKRAKMNLMPLLIVPLGFLAYVIYLKLAFNNPLYFLSAQTIFGQERSTTSIILLPQVLWRYFKILMTTHGLIFVNAVFELSSTIFVLFALYLALKKKFKAQWLVFSLLAVLTPTLTGTLTSMPRYILVAFPIYVVLAQIKNTFVKLFVVVISLILLFASTVLFTQGYWVA